ncbi:MAG TPA: hypothetical protein ENI77_07750 [Nitrospirae bacterium]|nr:hypothetical protein [Nitrospirota bacterium]
MAEEINEQLGCEVDLVAGSGGVFDIMADGKLIFSKFESGGSYPQPGEVVRLLSKKEISG